MPVLPTFLTKRYHFVYYFSGEVTKGVSFNITYNVKNLGKTSQTFVVRLSLRNGHAVSDNKTTHHINSGMDVSSEFSVIAYSADRLM